MGQKVHPIGVRLGINKTWTSKWYAEKDVYKTNLHQDLKIKKYLKKELGHAGVSKIEVERAVSKIKVTIHTSRPGVVIGKKGAGMSLIEKKLTKITNSSVIVNVIEVKKPDTDAQLVSKAVAQQLEKRISFRRAMKRSLFNSMKFGAKGIKIMVSGRLSGAEIARTEWYVQGSVPLQTLRADIDYGFSEAFTTYGVIGVKVWVYKGDIFDSEEERLTNA